jgi:hypothetical protein
LGSNFPFSIRSNNFSILAVISGVVISGTLFIKASTTALPKGVITNFDLPDDERLYSLELVSITFNENQAVVKINVISEAGRSKVFSLTI